MRNIVLVSLIVIGMTLSLSAQAPRAEVFGGYQFTHASASGESANFNGWNASVTGNINRWFGVTADFSGSYDSESVSGIAGLGDLGGSIHAYTYTFGPVVYANHEGTFSPFVHALFGGANLGASVSGAGSGSTNGFAVIAGGGADAKLSPHLAVRLFQADYVYLHFDGGSLNKNVRVSTGLVFRF